MKKHKKIIFLLLVLFGIYGISTIVLLNKEIKKYSISSLYDYFISNSGKIEIEDDNTKSYLIDNTYEININNIEQGSVIEKYINNVK